MALAFELASEISIPIPNNSTTQFRSKFLGYGILHCPPRAKYHPQGISVEIRSSSYWVWVWLFRWLSNDTVMDMASKSQQLQQTKAKARWRLLDPKWLQVPL